MDDRRQPPRPLDAEALERLALAHVQRVLTSRARLERHLARKIRERGWAGPGEPRLAELAARFVRLGLVDDRALAAARARGAEARGLGQARLRQRLAADGIAAEDAAEAVAALDPFAQAVAFARRRRIGPFGPPAADPAARARQLALMLRAGHPPELARRILAAESPEALAAGEACDQRPDPVRCRGS